jgi:hypothetical protein
MKTTIALALTLSLAAPALADPGQLTLDLPLPSSPTLALTAADTETMRLETTIFGLPRNVGDGDRVARGVIAAALVGLGVYGLASGEFSDAASGVLLGVSAVPASTAAAGYCPLYQALGLDTTALDF